ncbi:MAG: Gfo/Idh/MocA family oxidoreductase [Pirellulaceae bacterium]|jgi:predicted dehydrogenase|nr:Gfo/Idh/MocA family oxidoreductase [Pirellulaceae bacterium]MDG2470361.1 Gfo/Idh/MocA family oxidoreductase [Pirellulaceae bacterium]
MSKRQDRRKFVKSTAALGVGYWAAGGVTAKASSSSLEEVRFGCVGVGGKGSSDSGDANKFGKVVAICDIDDKTMNKAKARFDEPKAYNDYREMIEKEAKNIDAVTVSTPDHNHAMASALAMREGLHCFTQKPLTHSIYEARMLGDIAKEKNLVTQMGNQGTAGNCLRASAALIKSGVVGDLKEVHVWSNRPVWPQGDFKPKEMPAPDHVHWDLWIGPAKKHYFSNEIHNFKWRGFWDWGTGALGDMACHTLNMSYMAADLAFPTSVVAQNPGHNGYTYPGWSIIDFEFPATASRPGVKMVWYDGKKLPPAEVRAGAPSNASSGAMVIGTKGKFYSPGDYGGDEKNTGTIIDGKFTNWKDCGRAKYTRSRGHFQEFVDAIKASKPEEAISNFPNYAGPLTETILLGNLAVYANGTKVEWDAKNLNITNSGSFKPGVGDKLNEIVKHTYHNGYKLEA